MLKDVKFKTQSSFEFDVIFIESDPELTQRYQDFVPVLTLGDEELFYGKISAHRLQQMIETANRRKQGEDIPLLAPRYKAFLTRLRNTLLQRRLSRDKRH